MLKIQHLSSLYKQTNGILNMNKIKRVNPESLRIPTKSYSQGILIPLGNAELMFVTGQLPPRH